MRITGKCCNRDEEYAQATLFLLAHRRDLHPAFTTIDTVSLIYTYMTEGHLFQVTNEHGQIIALSAYYHGTPEQNFQDTHLAFIDIALADPAYRGSRLFVRGLHELVRAITACHQEVQELRFAALHTNAYNLKLYAKFARPVEIRAGRLGAEQVFAAPIDELHTMLSKWNKV